MRDTLHWLSYTQRITFKSCLLTYKCLHGLAPPYLSTTVCSLGSLSTALCRRPSAAVCPANPHNRRGFSCVLLCCSSIMERLTSAAPRPQSDTYWLQTDAENHFVLVMICFCRWFARAFATGFCNLACFDMSVYYCVYYIFLLFQRYCDFLYLVTRWTQVRRPHNDTRCSWLLDYRL